MTPEQDNAAYINQLLDREQLKARIEATEKHLKTLRKLFKLAEENGGGADMQPSAPPAPLDKA